jgi:UDP-N-acetyl-D-mannosaminuronic acid dehydrogenase
VEKMKRELVNKIRKKEAHIAVVGLGRVGLPTAAVFANAGFCVTGVDVKQKVAKAISLGKSPITEHKLDGMIKRLVKAGKLRGTTGILTATRNADIVIVCVPTPLTKDGRQDQTYLEKACRDLGKGLSVGKLVMIESTVAPGTMKSVVSKVLEDESGLKRGEDFLLAYCPERIAPGKAIRELMEGARIVGGFDLESAQIAADVLRLVTKGKILVTDCASAEVAKLAENTFRYVNIAFANELALICERLGVDVAEVIKLANTHSRVNIHTPGCGVGGACLPKDPRLLLRSAEEKGFRSKLTKSSSEVNRYMPKHTLELVVKALKIVGKDVGNSRVAVLGVTYKGEVDDVRNSPAKEMVSRLKGLGAEVVVYDPYNDNSFGAERAGDVMEAVEGADCVVIVTDHRMFKELNLERVKGLMRKKPVIVDGRRVVNAAESRKRGFRYFGIGYDDQAI